MRTIIGLILLALASLADAKLCDTSVVLTSNPPKYACDDGSYVYAGQVWASPLVEVDDSVTSLSDARDFTLLAETARTKCEKCKARCEANVCPKPTPSPTRSPTPPTHSFGKTCDYELRTTRTITFPVQDEPILICHTAEKPDAMIVVETTNGGNASCADFWLQMYSPTGAVSEPSQGSQPMAVLTPRVPGRYVIAVALRQANNQACSTLTFTVR